MTLSDSMIICLHNSALGIQMLLYQTSHKTKLLIRCHSNCILLDLAPTNEIDAATAYNSDVSYNTFEITFFM